MQHKAQQGKQSELAQGKLEEAKEAVTDRRGFLKWAGASTAAAGAQLASGTNEALAQAVQPKKKPALYRESDHIKRYYQLAR